MASTKEMAHHSGEESNLELRKEVDRLNRENQRQRMLLKAFDEQENQCDEFVRTMFVSHLDSEVKSGNITLNFIQTGHDVEGKFKDFVVFVNKLQAIIEEVEDE